jgi:hypothetical protein
MARKVYNETVGPVWENVNIWLLQYESDWKRVIKLTMSPVRYANGHIASCVALSSYRRLQTGICDRWLHSEWYWPNTRFVSMPAMCVALVHFHSEETARREEAGWPEPRAFPDEALPL